MFNTKKTRAICDAATSGEWEYHSENGYPWVSGPDEEYTGLPYTVVEWNETSDAVHADARFIAHARTALPAALDRVEALEAALDSACSLVSRCLDRMTTLRSETGEPISDEPGFRVAENDLALIETLLTPSAEVESK